MIITLIIKLELALNLLKIELRDTYYMKLDILIKIRFVRFKKNEYIHIHKHLILLFTSPHFF